MPFLRWQSLIKMASLLSCNPALGLHAVPTPSSLSSQLEELMLQSRTGASCRSYEEQEKRDHHLLASCNPALGLHAVPTVRAVIKGEPIVLLQSRTGASCRSYGVEGLPEDHEL